MEIQEVGRYCPRNGVRGDRRGGGECRRSLIVAPSSIFSGTAQTTLQLSGANFTFANLTGSTITYANLGTTQAPALFTGATTPGITSSSLSGFATGFNYNSSILNIGSAGGSLTGSILSGNLAGLNGSLAGSFTTLTYF